MEQTFFRVPWQKSAASVTAAKAYHVGVSGFSYPSWRGRFYPKEVKSEEFLAYYSQHLGSVEINSSFYAPPREATVKGWAEKTGGAFRFSFKAPRLITHILKLGKGSAEAANRFSKTLDPLGARRGPILFQLPPYSKEDPKLLEGFLAETAVVGGRRVFEFRHESWLKDSTYRLLEKGEVGFCIADTEEMPPTFQVTGGFAYFRLRRDSYDQGSIDEWARKIGEATKDVQETYVYLRHDETGENGLLAKRLAEALETTTGGAGRGRGSGTRGESNRIERGGTTTTATRTTKKRPTAPSGSRRKAS
jgi:uncharacterized protein YecE (DUF72 family)